MSEDMWDDVNADEFALPGDDQRQAAIATEAQQDSPQGRKRDDQGRFVAQAEPEPEADEEPLEGHVVEPDQEPPAEAEPSQAELIGGKFKSVDDLLRSYQELERNRGQLANEVGQLRRDVEEMRSAPRQPTPTPFGPTDEQIFEQPAAYAEWALQNGNEHLYQRSLAAMYESGDPQLAVQATRFELARGTAPLYEQLNELRGQTTATQAERDVQQWVRDHPDLDRYQQRMVELADQNPDIRATLETGNPAAVRLVLDHLYRLASAEAGPKPDNFAQAVRKAAQEADQEAAEAAVLSANRAANDAPKPSAADRLAEQWAEIDAVYDGWNI